MHNLTKIRLPASWFLTALAALPLASQAAPVDPVSAQIEHFAAASGVTHWPRLDLCRLVPPEEPSTISGMLLEVHVEGNGSYVIGTIHRAGRCHVPPKLRIKNWPEGKPAGTYVVAGRFLSRYRPVIEIVALMPNEDATGGWPYREKLQKAIDQKICAQPPRGKETDPLCEQLAGQAR